MRNVHTECRPSEKMYLGVYADEFGHGTRSMRAASTRVQQRALCRTNALLGAAEIAQRSAHSVLGVGVQRRRVVLLLHRQRRHVILLHMKWRWWRCGRQVRVRV